MTQSTLGKNPSAFAAWGFVALCTALLFAGCETDPVDESSGQGSGETMFLKVKFLNPDSVRVAKMYFRETSNLADTLYDTLFLQGPIHVQGSQTDSVLMDLDLQSLRWWNLDIEARDSAGNRVGIGSFGPIRTKSGESFEVSVTLPLSADSLRL